MHVLKYSEKALSAPVIKYCIAGQLFGSDRLPKHYLGRFYNDVRS
jgi:hypothetical protein